MTDPDMHAADLERLNDDADVERPNDDVDLERLKEDVDYLLTICEPRLDANGTSAGATILQFPTRTPSPSASGSGAAHVWNELTAAQAADAWTYLTAWVDWLTDRYQLEETLPGCWYRHGALVEELDALRAAWNGAYHDPAARPTDSATWHQLLALALTRIREWNRYGCTAGTHHDDLPVAAADTDRDSRDDYMQADIQARAASRGASR